MTWQCAELTYPAEHASAAGHFPGNPILPGALLLDGILATIAPAAEVTIRSAKFLRPARPGERLSLRWRALATQAIHFECEGASGIAATGTLAFFRHE